MTHSPVFLSILGMMHFVHTWNREVETALEGTYSLQRLTQKFEKAKEQVRCLAGARSLGLVAMRRSLPPPVKPQI